MSVEVIVISGVYGGLFLLTCVYLSLGIHSRRGAGALLYWRFALFVSRFKKGVYRFVYSWDGCCLGRVAICAARVVSVCLSFGSCSFVFDYVVCFGGIFVHTCSYICRDILCLFNSCGCYQ